MIERLLREKLTKIMIGEEQYRQLNLKNNNPTQKSRVLGKIFTRTLYPWFGIGLLLAFITYGYGLDSRQCNPCNQLIALFPSIDVAASKSDFPNVMRLIWLYLTVTTPLAFFAFTSAIPYWEFKNEPSTDWFFGAGILFILILLLAVWFYTEGGPFIRDVNHAGNSTKVFIHTIFGAYFISFSMSFMIAFSSYFLIQLPILYLKRQK